MPLLNAVFTVKSSLAGGANYSNTLFVGANPAYTNANNLVLTSDSSTGINIAKQFVAQVGAGLANKTYVPGCDHVDDPVSISIALMYKQLLTILSASFAT